MPYLDPGEAAPFLPRSQPDPKWAAGSRCGHVLLKRRVCAPRSVIDEVIALLTSAGRARYDQVIRRRTTCGRRLTDEM